MSEMGKKETTGSRGFKREMPYVFPMGLSVGSSKEDGIILIDFLDSKLENPTLFSCALPRSVAENLLKGLKEHLKDL